VIVALKTIGYMISVLSVVLLGVAAWQTLPDNQILRLCLIGGMAASIVGMLLRWTSHLMDQREKDKLAKQSQAASPVASAPEPANAERPAPARLYVAASDDPSPANLGSRGGSR